MDMSSVEKRGHQNWAVLRAPVNLNPALIGGLSISISKLQPTILYDTP